MHRANRRSKALGPPPDNVPRRLADRALGGGFGGGGAGAGGAGPGPSGHFPFARACASDEALVRRLVPVADLAGGVGDPATAGRAVGAVYSVAWSPGGALLAASGDDHRVRVWDIGAAGDAARAATMDVVSDWGEECVGRAPSEPPAWLTSHLGYMIRA